MNHLYKIKSDNTDPRNNSGEKYFYYDCLCVKCGFAHTAGFPKTIFLKHLIESGFFDINDKKLNFFFLDDNMKVKRMNIDGIEFEDPECCTISDDDFDVKSIIE